MNCSDFADPVIAEATIEFLILNKKKLQTSFPTVLPQVCSGFAMLSCISKSGQFRSYVGIADV